MIAFHVEWHTRKKLAPVLFDVDDTEGARAQHASPVEPARPSPSAQSKAARKRANGGKAVHNFHTLLADPSNVAVNDVSVDGSGTIVVVTTPTLAQNKAFNLLGIDSTIIFPAAGR